MQKSRFDFEQEIMDCWTVTDQIKTIYEYVGDHPDFQGMDPKHCDTIMNLLLGVQSIYDVKFDKLFRTFETLVHEGVIDDRNRRDSSNDNHNIFGS